MMPLTPLLGAALNHLLQGAEWARLRLRPFAGQSLALELGPLSLHLTATAEGLFSSQSAAAPAVSISLPASAPLLALQDVDLVMQQARISGNAEFAETLSFVFRNLDWDVEADLAPLLGDILAHRLVSTGRSLQRHLRQASLNLAANLSEYARDEAGLLASPAQMQGFSQQLLTLRDDVARLEKRLQHLERSPQP